jgi:hypothetical protein
MKTVWEMTTSVRRVPHSLCLMLAVGSIACSGTDDDERNDEDVVAQRWKAVLMTGDDELEVFDNARETIGMLWEERGVSAEDMTHLSRDDSLVGARIAASTTENLEHALAQVDVDDHDGCAVFMTSHGAPQGFDIRGRELLTPDRLDAILDRTCGARPTVVLVSACFSGVFIEDLEAPNRIVLTASRPDRASFGCAPRFEYTFWDGCLIEAFPSAETWSALHRDVTTCIEEREAELGEPPSRPQAFFGSSVATARIFSE